MTKKQIANITSITNVLVWAFIARLICQWFNNLAIHFMGIEELNQAMIYCVTGIFAATLIMLAVCLMVIVFKNSITISHQIPVLLFGLGMLVLLYVC